MVLKKIEAAGDMTATEITIAWRNPSALRRRAGVGVASEEEVASLSAPHPLPRVARAVRHAGDTAAAVFRGQQTRRQCIHLQDTCRENVVDVAQSRWRIRRQVGSEMHGNSRTALEHRKLIQP